MKKKKKKKSKSVEHCVSAMQLDEGIANLI